MVNTYQNVIQQTFDFPTKDFELIDDQLHFHEIPLTEIIEEHGTPLKITYLPSIKNQVAKARLLFHNAIKKCGYKGNYTYCYCTKSSHFSFIIKEVLKQGCQLEASSAFDLSIIRKLADKKLINKDLLLICNGFKRPLYIQYIADLLNDGYRNTIPVIDNMNELKAYESLINDPCKIGIRIATEEEPRFDFYTSRLGIRYKEIESFYLSNIDKNDNFELKMLHFFINSGMRDTTYFWNEMRKCLDVYASLTKICSSLDTLNIGGGLPSRNNLKGEIDNESFITELIKTIKEYCTEKNITEPNIITEFGTYTVAESGINLYSILDQKQQNDRELWYMIDNSFITTLPDTWGINQKFVLLAINNWNKEAQHVNLGGLTCDSLDYYNSEMHNNKVFLPKIDNTAQYIGFFYTGAYQEALSGYGGIKHCLIPSPKHIIIDKIDEKIHVEVFAEEQNEESMMKSLGY